MREEQEFMEWTILIERNLNGKFSATITGQWLIPDPPEAVASFNKRFKFETTFPTLEAASKAANERVDIREDKIKQNLYTLVAKETRVLYA